MRAIWAFLLLGAFAAPSFADSCGHHGRHRAHFPVFRPYRAVTHAYRVSNRHGFYHYKRRYHRYRYYWAYYNRPYSFYPHYRGSYGHYARYDYNGYLSRFFYPRRNVRYFNPFVRVAPLLHRLSVVFTLDDDVFHGDEVEQEPAAEAGSYDGFPRERTAPVGARFLEESP